jgi:hypothetical protein
MTRSILSGLLGVFCVVALGGLPLACQSGGVGDPCVPEDEYKTDFAGFKLSEENIESRSFQCQTRICLVNHFQGRVSCPLGQAKPVAGAEPTGCQTADSDKVDDKDLPAEKAKACCVPGTDTALDVEVCGQCQDGSGRDAEQAVYCSCRCGVAEGEPEDPNFNFCECPSGFACEEIRPNVGLGDVQLTGRYCIKQGTGYKKGVATCGTIKGHYNAAQCEGL